MKTKIQNIINKIKAIPKSEDEQIEFENLSPLCYELKILNRSNFEKFQGTWIETANREDSEGIVGERIMEIIWAPKNENKWNEYIKNKEIKKANSNAK